MSGLVSLIGWVLLTCPVPQKVVKEGAEPWNDHDEQVLMQAYAGCGKYYSESKCVITIYKYPSQHHAVICGKERGK
jgi:hypothetical protein